MGGQRHAQVALPPGKRHGNYCTGRRVDPQGWSGRVQKISPPPVFDPRTAESVASGYIDWAIAAHNYITIKQRK
jgi:hypothetical protein